MFDIGDESMNIAPLKDLNTHDDTFYIYPDGNEFSVTKMALATEELYKRYRKES